MLVGLKACGDPGVETHLVEGVVAVQPNDRIVCFAKVLRADAALLDDADPMGARSVTHVEWRRAAGHRTPGMPHRVVMWQSRNICLGLATSECLTPKTTA